MFSQYLSPIFNESIETADFTNGLKYADIILVYIVLQHPSLYNKHEKDNYGPVRIIPVISQILKRCLYEEMYQNIDNTFPKNLMGFRNGYSCQHSLIAMFENLKKNLDKGEKCGALFVDLIVCRPIYIS